jgi:RNA polymerase sigma factor (sigma-70 family)
MDHAELVKRAAQGDVKAFVELTRRFQQFAFGSALTHVRDFQRAEDVTQEALIAAWTALPTLTEPVAFAGWLRGIVRHHASRSLRRKRVQVVPLAEAEELSDDAPPPDHILERRRQAAAALAAIADLPKALREPATLFFIHDCSHQDIATFLELPPATVNNRIHAARTHLKQRILTMSETLQAHALPDDFANRIGRLIEARGQVVEALFDPAAMPDLMSELTVSDEIRKRGVPVQVMQRLPHGRVRGIAASPVAHVPRGATVLNSRRRATTPIDRAQVEYLLGQLAANKASNDIVETGIKVIDVMCPIRAGGSVAIATEYGAGMTVVLEEIVRRISKGPHPVTMLALFPPPSEIWPPSLDENYSIAEGLAKDGYSDGNVGSVQTFFVGGEPQPWTDEKLAKFASVDTLIHLTRDMIVRKTYPGVELRTTRSRLLDDALIDADDVNLARRIRELITASRAAETDSASALDPVLTERTAKLQAYFSQPFFVAEPYTKRPGSVVTRASALRTCREILDGLHDDLTADDFYFTGDIEEIRQAAGRS